MPSCKSAAFWGLFPFCYPVEKAAMEICIASGGSDERKQPSPPQSEPEIYKCSLFSKYNACLQTLHLPHSGFHIKKSGGAEFCPTLSLDSYVKVPAAHRAWPFSVRQTNETRVPSPSQWGAQENVFRLTFFVFQSSTTQDLVRFVKLDKSSLSQHCKRWSN